MTSIKYTAGLCEEVGARYTEAIGEILAVAKSGRAVPTGCAAVLVWALPTAHDKVLNLAREINDGELLQKGDPAYALRRWISLQRFSTREMILATCGVARYVIQGKPLLKISAGAGEMSEKDGFSNYTWLVQRRRGMRLMDGTPSVELVPPRARGEGER